MGERGAEDKASAGDGRGVCSHRNASSNILTVRRCSGTREVKGHGWLGTFREEVSSNFLTLRGLTHFGVEEVMEMRHNRHGCVSPLITSPVKNRIGDSQLTIEFLDRYKPLEIERVLLHPKTW